VGPDVAVKAVFAAERKFCGELKWLNEVSVWHVGFTYPFDDVERLVFKDERSIPTGWPLDCTTPAKPSGPTGNWLFNRTSCEIAPGSEPTCTCPGQTLRVGMNEAQGGASIALDYPDFPGAGFPVNQETTSRYQGCSNPIGGFVQCAVINFDLPEKRTATMGGAAVSAACSISSNWQGAMQ
jgi:hypothetical protein